jgi:hypothetical protein
MDGASSEVKIHKFIAHHVPLCIAQRLIRSINITVEETYRTLFTPRPWDSSKNPEWLHIRCYLFGFRTVDFNTFCSVSVLCIAYFLENFFTSGVFFVLFLTSRYGVEFDHLRAHVIQPNEVDLHFANVHIPGVIHCLHRRLFEYYIWRGRLTERECAPGNLVQEPYVDILPHRVSEPHPHVWNEQQI